MTKKFSRKRTLVTGLAAAAVTLGLGFWTVKTRFGDMQVPAYQVARVVDGDTFRTTENQIIRLAGIQAPEVGNCYAEESTQALTKLVTGQKLYLKVVYTDTYKRHIALVYTPSGFVNEAMVRQGAAFVSRNDNYGHISEAVVEARENQRGIFSSQCLQPVNPDNPKCNIKGNVDLIRPDEKVYHFPGCDQYNQTLVQLAEGDRWFCTKKEAEAAGFVKSQNCP